MNDKKYRFSLAGQPLYPHIKLTRERFPRLLATRILHEDNAEYFGAFLTRSAARILIDFLNQTFRLRTCVIDIDGDFPVPCTQYYAKRCLGPCVKSLCNEGSYTEMAELAKLFLSNERERFNAKLLEQIEEAAANLDFEKAAVFRDIGVRVAEFWRDKKRRVWLGDAVDTLVLEVADKCIKVYLVTQRERRMLGMRVFVWPVCETPAVQALADVISQFYRYHAPREIRVSDDFPGRLELSRELGRRFDRAVNIAVIKVTAQQITTERALVRTKLEDTLVNIKPRPRLPEILRDLEKIFGLGRLPKRIEAFDVAHISGSDLVGARSVWENGRFKPEEYEFWFIDERGELEALREVLRTRFSTAENWPDLVLIDGGQSHLNAALKALADTEERRFSIIAAVKPPGKHSEISHFLTENGKRVEFNPETEVMRILKVLRDEAHDLANATHRQSRDMGYFYELAGILPSLNERERQVLLVKSGTIRKVLEMDEKELVNLLGQDKGFKAILDLKDHIAGRSIKLRPLIVQIRFDDPNGEASDLRPIEAFRQQSSSKRTITNDKF